MGILSTAGSWALGQFTKNFLGGKKDTGGSLGERLITAGVSTFADKMMAGDKPGKKYTSSDVNFGAASASTYAMSAAKGPDTPEVEDYAAVEAKWTRIAKKLGDIQDTTAVGS